MRVLQGSQNPITTLQCYHFLPRNSTSPVSDVAVIQGKNGCHVEIDLTDSVLPDELQLNSVELTETHVSVSLYSSVSSGFY